MDRQHRPNGALRHAHLPPRRPAPCEHCDMYRPVGRTDCTMAIACGCIDLGPGEPVAFTDGCDSGNTVSLHTPGIYYAVCTLHMPEGQATSADLRLMLDDCPLPESCLHVRHNGAGTGHAQAQAMFEITGPARLQLMTTAPLQLQGDCPLITLAVFRIA